MGHSSDVNKLSLSDDGIDVVPMDVATGTDQTEKADKGLSGKVKMLQK